MDSDRIVVQLPGVDDPERVKRLIKNTAFLEFRLVDYPAAGGGGVATREEVLAPATAARCRRTSRSSQATCATRRAASIGQQLLRRREAPGDHRPRPEERAARSRPVQRAGGRLHALTAEGAKLFGDATGANIGRGLAIVLDGKMVSAPRINARITDSGIIEGSFTQQEVEDLSTVLRSGALPAGITYLEERTVGPSLGHDSIRTRRRAPA